MREAVLLNAISVVAGSFAISVACKVTRSGLPLFAFLLLPRWNFSHTPYNEEKEEEDDGDRG